MKLFILSGLVFCNILFFADPTLSISIENIPNPRQNNGGWVIDIAKILTDKTEKKLNSKLSQFENQTSIEMVVVTVINTKTFPSPKAFTTKLFNTWLIGKKNSNNGLLLVISVAERRIEIETGSGLQKILTREKIEKILTTEITPLLNKNDFNRATLVGIQALIKALSKEIPIYPKDRGIVLQFINLSWQIFLTVTIAIVFTIVCLFFHRFERKSRDLELAGKQRKSVTSATIIDRGWALFLDLIFLIIVYTVIVFFTARSYEPALILSKEEIPLPIAISLISGNLEAALDFGFLTAWSSFGGSVFIYRIIAQGCLRCTLGQLSTGLRVIQADDSPLGVTPKRLRDLRIKEEQPIGLYRAFLRNLLMIVDGCFFYLVGIVAINRSDKSQRLGDYLAGTVVISRQTNLPYSSALESPYIAGGSFGLSSIDSDFGGGTSDGGGAGADF